jgi:hypothetical protein
MPPSVVNQAVSMDRVSNVDWWIRQDYPTARLRMPHVFNYTNLEDHIPHWSVTVRLGQRPISQLDPKEGNQLSLPRSEQDL